MNTFSTGEFGSPIAGMRIFYTDAFPTAVTNENTEVIVTGPTTAAIAMGAAGDPTGLENAAGLRQEIIRDPETGLSFTYREWVNTATGFHWGAIAMMYGTAFCTNAVPYIIAIAPQWNPVAVFTHSRYVKLSPVSGSRMISCRRPAAFSSPVGSPAAPIAIAAVVGPVTMTSVFSLVTAVGNASV